MDAQKEQYSDAFLRAMLHSVKCIAIIGLSDNPERSSYGVAEYLKRYFRIVPVNPKVTSVLGETSYPSLGSIPADIKIDLVNVFRRSEEVPPIVDETIARGVSNLWLQLGVRHDAAATKARGAGINVVQDICIAVAHSRLKGQVHA